jgi:hypothetical protein
MVGAKEEINAGRGLELLTRIKKNLERRSQQETKPGPSRDQAGTKTEKEIDLSKWPHTAKKYLDSIEAATSREDLDRLKKGIGQSFMDTPENNVFVDDLYVAIESAKKALGTPIDGQADGKPGTKSKVSTKGLEPGQVKFVEDKLAGMKSKGKSLAEAEKHYNGKDEYYQGY